MAVEKPTWMTDGARRWRRGREVVRFDNPWIRVSEIQATAPTGAPALYGLVSFKNRAIAVLPIHEDGTVTLVGQPRFPAGDYSWEIPEGGAPMDEDPLDGAKRELLEETGLVAERWDEVLRVQLSNSVTDETAVGYLATGLAVVAGVEGDGTEDIALARAPFREVVDAAMSGHIADMLTVAMLLKAYHMAREGLLPDGLARLMLQSTRPSDGERKL